MFKALENEKSLTIQRLPEDLDYSNGSRFLKTGSIFFAEYQQREPGVPRFMYITQHAIIFVTEGKKVFYLTEGPMEVVAGNMIILPKGCYMMCEGLSLEEKYSSISLFLDDSLLKDFWMRYKELIRDSRRKNVSSDTIITLKTEGFINHFKDNFLEYFEYKGQFVETLIRHKLEELLLLLLHSEIKENIYCFFQEIYDNYNHSLEDIVLENLYKKVTVEELARLSNRSLSAFKKDFKKIYHESPHKYISSVKLENARFQLLNSSLTISEIANNCGFENPSHFIRLFKANYKVTPSIFRNQNGHFKSFSGY